MLQYD